jgi:hypothetical protein
VDGIYFRADVTAGLFGAKQKFIEITIVHDGFPVYNKDATLFF